MSSIRPLFPRQPVPDLTVSTTAGRSWTLAEQNPETFTLVVFYRGLHCPICARQLGSIDKAVPELNERGVEVIAISGDSEERARRAVEDWGLENLQVGFGFPTEEARRWGLYLSNGIGVTSIGVEEPALFSEPGLFLIRPDGTLFFGSVQTMPFTRPPIREVIGAIDFVLKVDYPARGEVLG